MYRPAWRISQMGVVSTDCLRQARKKRLLAVSAAMFAASVGCNPDPLSVMLLLMIVLIFSPDHNWTVLMLVLLAHA
jgi:hypothetical protein